VKLLGPVAATLDGRPIPLGATKQRALLAVLALHANVTVPIDRLVDALWGDDPPATAPKMVQLYVSQLRRLFAGGDAEIVTHGRGYELRVEMDAVDAGRFERLVERVARAEGVPGEALALWSGAPLADVADEPFAAPEIRRLEALWLRAAELAVDGDLAAGRDEKALAQVDGLLADHPLREHLHAQRMLALYRSGRQAEALEAYVAARRRLVDDIGVEPSAELRELHERILRQDPALRLPSHPTTSGENGRAPPAERIPRTPRARPLMIAAGVAAGVAVVVFALSRLLGPDHLPGITEGWVGVIDAEAAAVTTQYHVGSAPGAVAEGAGSVWVANPHEGTVSRIHREGDRVDTLDVGRSPTALAFGGGSLWVVDGDSGSVAQVDPVVNKVVQRIPVGNGVRAVAVGYGAVWAATALDGAIVRIDLRSGRAGKPIAIGGHPAALVTGAGSVWAAREESATVARIDARSGEILDGIPVGNGPTAVAFGLGAAWTANRTDGTVSRIDAVTDAVTTTPAGRRPSVLAIAGGAVWIGDATGRILRLDPRTRALTTVPTGSSPAGLAAVDATVWASGAAPPAAHRGGTLRVGTDRGTPLDPATGGYDPDAMKIVALAYEGLVAFSRASGGPSGARLVPALAVSVPEPAGGLRYVFRLRPGLRYSDGARVHAADVRTSMERMLVVLNGAFPAPMFDAIVGAPGCTEKPARCDLSRGITTDDRTGTITIMLSRPDPDLLFKLALPLAAIVPANTPRRLQRNTAPLGTGPYRIERFVDGRSETLVRNPHFVSPGPDGPAAGFADRIEVTTRGERARVAAVERGQLDVTGVFTTATAGRLAALRTRADARVESGSGQFMEYAWMNVHAPPFDDVRVRRAVNLAVDRRLAVDVTGGPEVGETTCQVLPAGLPGYRPVCPFTVAPSSAGSWIAPDRSEAQRLVAASGTQGARIDVAAYVGREPLGRQLVRVLEQLGFRPRLRVYKSLTGVFKAALDPRHPAQIGINGWIADFPEPASFVRTVLGCNEYVPGEPGLSGNFSRFCDPHLDAALDRARATGAVDGDTWLGIERRIAAQAPIVPLVAHRQIAVTSRRAGNVQFHPLSGVILEQVWVR
jgi:peptide/nickel transport system substrate-binding protein